MSKKQILKRIGFAIFCMAVGIFLYSRRHMERSWTEQKMSEEAQSSGVEFPARFEKTVEKGLKFDVEVDAGNVPKGGIYQAAMVRRAGVEKERIYDSFFQEGEELSEAVYENYRDSERMEQPVTVYENEDVYLSVSDYEFSLFRDSMSYILNSFYLDEGTDEYNAALYSETSDLKFMDREEAWKNVAKMMEDIGFSMKEAAVRVVYSLDRETLEREETCTDINGREAEEEKNPNWSSNDEGYYYYITQQWQGIPLYCYNKLNEDRRTDTPLTVYQAGDGFRQVRLSRWFEFEAQEEKVQLADFNRIMDTVEKKYSGTLKTNPVTVVKATLYFFPVKTETENLYSLEPIWVCTLEEEHVDLGDDSYTSCFYMPVHAVTGMEAVFLEN